MKQFFIFILVVAPLILSAQATVNNSGVFSPTDLTTHNIVMKNGNISFEGSIDSYGELPDKKEFNNSSGTWCFTVNINHATTGAGQSIISKTEALGSYAGLHIFEDSGRIALQIKNYTNSQTLTLKADAIAGTGTHFISVTFVNNVSVKLYIDGVLRKEGKPPYFLFSKNPIRLGCSLDTFWKPFDGELTNIEIYKDTLSAIDIACLFHARKAVPDKFFMFPNPTVNECILEFPQTTSGMVHLLDAGGRAVQVIEFKEAKIIKFNTSLLAKGIYFVKISGAENYEVQKLVISGL